MEQQANDSIMEIVWNVLANPADTQLYIDELESLISQYPQSNLLHTLAARLGNEQLINTAAVYFNGQSLYRLVNNHEPLPAVKDYQLINLDTAVFNTAPVAHPAAGAYSPQHDSPLDGLTPAEINPGSEPNPAPSETPVAEEPPFSIPEPEPLVQEPETSEDEPVTDRQPEEAAVEPAPTLSDWQPTEANIHPPAEPIYYTHNYKAAEPAAAEEVEPAEATLTEPLLVSQAEEPVNEVNDDRRVTEHQEPEEEEVYDEIVGIDDIEIAPVPAIDRPLSQPVQDEPYYTSYTEQLNDEIAAPVPAGSKPDFDLEDQITESIYATDYFAFKDALVEEPPAADERQTMARYHDDNLPYSFLWWLDKTRREYANVYQPYARPAVLPHIGELRDDKDKPEPSLPDPKQKKEEIIERFIQAEPQIKPPSGDKLDNENIARHSAEDSDELVTETLARIYTDQMLYHKAIATYKKLMLRYPEKSSYFAGQIKILENKIN